jgi:hypothetical protein
MKMRGGTKSHYSRQILIRFTEEEGTRAFKTLRKRRLTMQAFGHAAIMKALNELELGKKTDAELIQEARLGMKQEEESTKKGFGIREQLQEDRERDAERTERVNRDKERERFASATVSAPSLTATTIDGEILALARSVVEAPKGEQRTTVLRASCRALAPRARSEEEAKYLVDQLYDAVKRLEGVPVSALEKVRARMGR